MKWMDSNASRLWSLFSFMLIVVRFLEIRGDKKIWIKENGNFWYVEANKVGGSIVLKL